MTKILNNYEKSQNMHLMTGKLLKIKAEVAKINGIFTHNASKTYDSDSDFIEKPKL